MAVQTQGHDKAQSETASRYYYAAGRRVLSQQGITDQADLRTNTRKAVYQSGTHRWLGVADTTPTATSTGTQDAQYTANGQPSRIGEREYVWDALGQLTAVRQQDQSLASYTYSHRGERIGKTVSGATTQYLYNEAGQISAELDANGRITRQYLYLADQPIAVIDTPDGEALSNQELFAHDTRGLEAENTLRIRWYSATSGSAKLLTWLHTNHRTYNCAWFRNHGYDLGNLQAQ